MKRFLYLFGIFFPVICLILFIFTWLHPSLVFAGSTSTTVPISATVITSCSITNSPTISFGNYDPLVVTDTQNSSGNIAVKCSNGTVATISLNFGSYSANATGTTRAMKTGSNYLSYDIFLPTASGNPFSGSVWGDGTTKNSISTATVASSTYSSGAFQTQTFTLNGQIPANQNAPAGAYSDTVTASVSF